MSKLIECEIYDRTVGYFSSTNQMNKGKKEEQRMRKRFDANKYLNGKKMTKLEEKELTAAIK